MNPSAKNTLKEKFIAQKKAIETLQARVSELEALLAGPQVGEKEVQTLYLNELGILSVNQSETVQIVPDVLLAGDKIKELELLTKNLQDELRKSNQSENTEIDKYKIQMEQLLKTNSQQDAALINYQREVDRLSSQQVEQLADIRKLHADINEKNNTIEKLQNSQKKLFRDNSDYESVLKEKNELLDVIDVSRKARKDAEEKARILEQNNTTINNEKLKIESSLRKEISLLQDKLDQYTEREKSLLSKISSAESSSQRTHQRISESESMISSLQADNSQLTKENVKLATELNQALIKIRDLSQPKDNSKALKEQLANAKKENQIYKDTISQLESKISQHERNNDMLSNKLQYINDSINNGFGTSTFDDAIAKFSDYKIKAKQVQKENSDLRIQLAQTKSLRFDLASANKKVADLQQSIDYHEARMTYLKQIVMQLLTSPFSQRAKIADILIDFMSFNAEERETIMKSPANGKDLSSRLLYAFEPWV